MAGTETPTAEASTPGEDQIDTASAAAEGSALASVSRETAEAGGLEAAAGNTESAAPQGEETAAPEQLAGRVYTDAEIARLVQAETDRREAKRQKELEKQRLREAREKGDYLTLGEHLAQQLEAEEAQSGEQAQLMAAAGQVQGHLVATVKGLFDGAVVDAVAGKTYDGDAFSGVLAWVKDLADAQTTHNEQQLFATWEKERGPALRKELLAELNGGEPVPDLGGGAAPAQRTWTREAVANLSPAEYAQHRTEIMAALYGGRK